MRLWIFRSLCWNNVCWNNVYVEKIACWKRACWIIVHVELKYVELHAWWNHVCWKTCMLISMYIEIFAFWKICRSNPYFSHKFAIQEVKLDFYVKWRSNGSWSVEIRNSHSYHNVSRKFCEIVFSIDKTSNKSNWFDEIFWNVSLQTKGSVVGREISCLEFRDETGNSVSSRLEILKVLSCVESKFQSGLKSWLVPIWFWKFSRQNG